MRYRLVESSYLTEGVSDFVANMLEPIKNKRVPLNWSYIEDTLGGPVPLNVRSRIEDECGGKVFRSAILIRRISISLAPISLPFLILLFDKVGLFIFLSFVVSFCASYILSYISKKRISKADIEDCVKSAKNGQLKSDIIYNAVIHASYQEEKITKTKADADALQIQVHKDLKKLFSIRTLCDVIIYTLALMGLLGLMH